MGKSGKTAINVAEVTGFRKLLGNFASVRFNFLSLFTGETLSNLDGLTSEDEEISLENPDSSLENNQNGDKEKLEFSALLATMQPKLLPKKGMLFV